MTDRRSRRTESSSHPESAGPRREFSMVPIEPGAWALAVDLLRLSPLQANIVALLVQDADEREIGIELGLTRETVRVYLMDIYRHVGLKSRDDLIGIIKAM